MRAVADRMANKRPDEEYVDATFLLPGIARLKFSGRKPAECNFVALEHGLLGGKSLEQSLRSQSSRTLAGAVENRFSPVAG